MEELENLVKVDEAARLDERELRVRAVIGNIDEETRSFDVVFATETPVQKYDWNRGVYIDEILEISESAIDTKRIAGAAGIPFLDNHSSWEGSKGLFGRCDGLTITGKKAKSRVQMSTRAEDDKLEGMWHDIKTGILSSVSVGYTVQTYERVMAKEGSGKRDTYIAKRWTPMEISAALIPADHNSVVVRTAGTKTPEPEQTTTEIEIMERRSVAPLTNNVNTKTAMEKTPEQIAAENAAVEKRAAEIAEQKIAAMQARNAEIENICRDLNLPTEKRTEFLNSQATADEVRKLAIAEYAKADPNKGASGGIRVGGDVDANFGQRVSDALTLDVTQDTRTVDEFGKLVPMDAKRIEAAREFRRMSSMDLVEEFNNRRNLTFARGDREGRVEAALQVRSSAGYTTTADLPNVLRDVISNILRRAYALRPKTWSQWAGQDPNIPNFRRVYKTQLGSAPTLKRVGEGEEYTVGTAKDSAESYMVAKFGRKIAVTFETIINDELGAYLSRYPAQFGARIAELENQTCYGILLDNANMADGIPLFHADHANLAASGTALDAANVKAGITAMRKQKSLGTQDEDGMQLNIEPRFLIVGAAHEWTAKELVGYNTNRNATKTSDVNSLEGMLEVVVDNEISGANANNWFLAADPMLMDTVEMGFLAGERINVRTKESDSTDGVEWRVRTVHGAGALDYRGLYKNPGL